METDERNTNDEVNDGVVDMSEDCEGCCCDEECYERKDKSCEIIQANNGFVVTTDNGTLIALNMEEALDIVREELG